MANRQTDGKHENAINPWIIWYYWILATLFMKETSRSASFLLTDKSLFMNNLIFLNISNHIRERSLQLCIIYGDWQEPAYGHDHLLHTSRYWRWWWCLPGHQGVQIMIRCSVSGSLGCGIKSYTAIPCLQIILFTPPSNLIDTHGTCSSQTQSLPPRTLCPTFPC